MRQDAGRTGPSNPCLNLVGFGLGFAVLEVGVGVLLLVSGLLCSGCVPHFDSSTGTP